MLMDQLKKKLMNISAKTAGTTPMRESPLMPMEEKPMNTPMLMETLTPNHMMKMVMNSLVNTLMMMDGLIQNGLMKTKIITWLKFLLKVTTMKISIT